LYSAAVSIKPPSTTMELPVAYRERMQRRLRCAIERDVGLRHEREARGDVHNCRSCLRAEVRQSQRTQVHRRFQIDCDLFVQAFPIGTVRHCDAPLNSGIVHQHVQVGEFSNRPLDEPAARPRIRHVAHARDEPGKPSFRLLQDASAPAADDHAAAGREQPRRECQPYSRASAGDENGARPEIHAYGISL
jgi:hypothetical protein